MLRLSLLVDGLQSFLCLSLAGWTLYEHVHRVGVTGDLLLLVYWVLKLPAIGRRLADATLQYPSQRNIALRLLEPLGAPDESETITGPASADESPAHIQASFHDRQEASRSRGGVAITLHDASVVAAGHTILSHINLSLKPAEHIAVVGRSGAGKSSFLGLLLGWHRSATGQVLIDGEPLCGERILALRRETAWVDPAIQIWNRSLLDNLRYCSTAGPLSGIGEVIEHANLGGVLVRLPDGLQSPLGEGGARLSGGEGQRVRMARAMWQTATRLVLLDEPFRGLDRDQRQRHLAGARAWWRDATLICVTHDVLETRAFSRVLVIDDGRIVEDGAPEELARAPGSRHSALLRSEEALHRDLWGAALWRRLRLAGGRVHEDHGTHAHG